MRTVAVNEAGLHIGEGHQNCKYTDGEMVLKLRDELRRYRRTGGDAEEHGAEHLQRAPSVPDGGEVEERGGVKQGIIRLSHQILSLTAFGETFRL